MSFATKITWSQYTQSLWRSRFGLYCRFEGEGGDGGGGGETPWHSDVPYFKDNPEAVKAFSKYKTADEGWKGAHEAIKQLGTPYRLPKDPTTLNDQQKTEILASVAKMKGVPETAEGYGDFDIGEDVKVPIDEETLAAFKVLCHKQGKTKTEAQEILNLQLGMVQRLNQLREKTLKEMTEKNYARWVAENDNSEPTALLRMGWVKEFLQSKCVDENGQPDPKQWEGFAKRIMYQDRVIELPLLRALADAAQQSRGTGGAPMGTGGTPLPPGVFSYPEMKGKKK